ncbi:AMP nucleosidase [Escherichia coli]|nr:AMP nucleosidase [Escherichia coli]
MLPSETMIWQPEFTDKTLSRKPGAVHKFLSSDFHFRKVILRQKLLLITKFSV